MTKTILCLYVALFCVQASAEQDVLFERFQQPTAEARPFVRWWWGDNRVEAKEIVRELDLLKAAGIGGVEIVPIGIEERPHAGLTTPEKKWLSPEWCELVKFTCDEAAKRGMIVDVSHSYGWPARGEWLKPEHRAAKIFPRQQKLRGPTVFKKELSSLPGWVAGRSSLKYARLVPADFQAVEQVLNFDEAVIDGVLTIKVPAGDYVLQTGIYVKAFEGDMLDHLDREAVLAYHNYISDQMQPVFGGDLGSGIRAFFADSIELKGSNWTRSFEDEFRKRCGYDVMPWVSFLPRFHLEKKNYNDPFTPSAEMREQLREVRYDYNRTLVELVHENFIAVFSEWCDAHNVTSRLQVYGWPWLYGIESGNLIPEIPEGNSWISFSEKNTRQAWEAWGKFAVSGAHARGRRVVSVEAMTTVREPFEVSLDRVKRADDFNFVSGLNHNVLHGFNYSPPEVQWPGVVIYGTFFSEHNPWWPYFPEWVEYSARLCQVFQDTRTVVEVGLMGPTADTWSAAGLERDALQQQAWYAYDFLWKSFSSLGANVDFLSAQLLDEADVSKGRIAIGPMAYKLLVLCDVQTLQLSTMQRIHAFVSNGGQLAVVGEPPAFAAGATEVPDAAVTGLMQELLEKYPGQVKQVAAPEKGSELLAWTGQLLNQFDLDRAVTITQPDDRLFQIHYKADDGRDFVFFCNQTVDRSIQTDVEFSGMEGAVSRWNPETGERARVAPQATESMTLTLAPGASRLLVFEDPTCVARLDQDQSVQEERLPKEEQILDGEWTVELLDVSGEQTETKLSSLADLSNMPGLESFAGTAVYRKAVDLRSGWDAIDLGAINGTSELTVNGQSAGTRWYGQHRYDVSGLLVDGSNEFEIKVTTLLFNRIRDYENGDYLWQGVKKQKQKQKIPAGITGPVRLLNLQ